MNRASTSQLLHRAPATAVLPRRLSLSKPRLGVQVRAVAEIAGLSMDVILQKVVPTLGAIISTGMYFSPLSAVLKANKERSIGVSDPLENLALRSAG